MADIRTAWVGQAGAWLVEGGDLASDNGLETAVILSLFTDALATTQEARDAGVTERRGWWADAYAEVPGDRIGSKLWLLSRSKRLPSTLKQAQQYAADALAWLVADGVAESVDVVAELVGTDVLGLTVTVRRRAAPVARYRFDAFWKGA
jgi:phage gp46-like protein